jgi:hypothetical protein
MMLCAQAATMIQILAIMSQPPSKAKQQFEKIMSAVSGL